MNKNEELQERTNITLLEEFVDSCIQRKLFHFEEAEALLSKLVSQPPKSEPVDLITFNQSIVIDRKEVVKKLINLKRHDRFSFELKDGSFFHNKIFIAISGCVCKCKLLYNNDDGSSGEIDNVEDVEYVVKHIINQPPKAEPVDVEEAESLVKILMDGYIDIQDGIQSVDGVAKIILSQSPHQTKE